MTTFFLISRPDVTEQPRNAKYPSIFPGSQKPVFCISIKRDGQYWIHGISPKLVWMDSLTMSENLEKRDDKSKIGFNRVAGELGF